MDAADFYRREAADCRRRADHMPRCADRSALITLARHYERQASLADGPPRTPQSTEMRRVP
jgi:hypothetical protein